jgi:hypothetical protein
MCLSQRFASRLRDETPISFIILIIKCKALENFNLGRIMHIHNTRLTMS